MYAVVDIGSNTIRFKIYRRQAGAFVDVMGKKFVAGLSSYVENGAMTPAGIHKLIGILTKIKHLIDDLGIAECYVFATAAVRNASNAKNIIKEVEQATGLVIDLLSGKEESYCDYLGVKTLTNHLEDSYIIDIGGGSTEIIVVTEGKFLEAESIPQGSLSCYQKSVVGVIPTAKEAKKMKSYMERIVGEYTLKQIQPRVSYGVGGTIRSAGNILQEYYQRSDNKRVDREHLSTLIDLFIAADTRAIRTLLQVSPDRVHTIVPGMLILQTLMEKLTIEELTVVDHGVREGYLSLRKEA